MIPEVYGRGQCREGGKGGERGEGQGEEGRGERAGVVAERAIRVLLKSSERGGEGEAASRYCRCHDCENGKEER